MELLLSPEQEMLRQSASVFAARNQGADRLRHGKTEIDRQLWSEIAAAGWLAILVPERDGGLGLGLTELCLVCHQLGQHLLPEPVAEVAAVARTLADTGGDPAGLTALLEGRTIKLPALAQGRGKNGVATGTRSIMRLDGIELSSGGQRSGVAGTVRVDGFLIAATACRDNASVLVSLPASDVQVESLPLADGTTSGTIRFSGNTGHVVAGPNNGPEALRKLRNTLHLATAAQLLGVMEAAHQMTVDYLRTREQFGRPIGAFQALQHRAVNNLTAVEACRSLVYQAAGAVDAGSGSPGLSSAAISFASERALEVCKSAIQMHGGIGFTDDHDIGLYLKRTIVLSARYGSPRQMRADFRDMIDIG